MRLLSIAVIPTADGRPVRSLDGALPFRPHAALRKGKTHGRRMDTTGGET